MREISLDNAYGSVENYRIMAMETVPTESRFTRTRTSMDSPQSAQWV
jgi:hypothetical protein